MPEEYGSDVNQYKPDSIERTSNPPGLAPQPGEGAYKPGKEGRNKKPGVPTSKKVKVIKKGR